MKYAWIFLDDQVAEAVEGADLDLVGFGADIFDEAMAHFGSGGIGVGEAQDAGRGSVGFAYDITDAEGEDFCFSGTVGAAAASVVVAVAVVVDVVFVESAFVVGADG